MKILIIYILLSIPLYTQENIKDNNQMYSFIYEFNNDSLGPIEGRHRANIYMKNNQIISILNLKTGTTSKNILGIDKLLEAIALSDTQLITYEDNHFPKTIRPKYTKDSLGSYYIIRIEDFHVVDDIKSIKIERMIELHKNYTKWIRFSIKNYSYIYQDSRKKSIYMEGVEISIKDTKIIKVFNARSMENIKLSLCTSLLSIENVFTRLKESLDNNKNIEVLYDKKYGYPYLVTMRKNNKIVYQIFIRKLQIGK